MSRELQGICENWNFTGDLKKLIETLEIIYNSVGCTAFYNHVMKQVWQYKDLSDRDKFILGIGTMIYE